MTWALAGHEMRRAGWPALTAVPVLLGGGALIALALAAKGSRPDVLVAFWLREVVALAFGLAIAAVPAAERCLEMQLSLPTAVTVTLSRRAALCGLWSAAATTGAALAAGWTGVWHPWHGLLTGQLTWASPALALAGVGAACFALSGSTAGACAMVSGIWLAQDLSGQWFTSHAWSRPLYLFADDSLATSGGWWWANRLTLLAAGALLLGLAIAALSSRQERVLAARLRDQSEDS